MTKLGNLFVFKCGSLYVVNKDVALRSGVYATNKSKDS